MSAAESWSVRGIAQQARRAAKSAAQQEGVSLGEWLNKVILEQKAEQGFPGNPQEASRRTDMENPSESTGNVPSGMREVQRIQRLTDKPLSPVSSKSETLEAGASNDTSSSIGTPREGRREGKYEHLEALLQSLSEKNIEASATNLERLAEQLEALETRSSLAMIGLDKAIQGLSTRLETTDSQIDEQSKTLENTVQHLTISQGHLSEQLDALTQEQSAKTDKFLQESETRFAQLSDQLSDQFSENLQKSEQKQNAQARQYQLDLEKVQKQVEQTKTELLQHIQKELSSVKADPEISDFMLQVKKRDQDSQKQIEQRFEHYQNTVDSTLNTLEASFQKFEGKLKIIEEKDQGREQKTAQKIQEEKIQTTLQIEKVSSALKEDILRVHGETTQQIQNLENSGNSSEPSKSLNQLENRIFGIQEKIQASEKKQTEGLKNIAQQVGLLGTHVRHRLKKIEGEPTQNTNTFFKALETRIDSVENKNARTIQFIGEQVADVSERLVKRVTQSEERSAEALEDMVEQVSKLTSLSSTISSDTGEAGSDSASQTSEIKQILQENELHTQNLIEKALGNVQEQIQTGEAGYREALNPVQKTIDSLALRLSAIEKITIENYEKQTDSGLTAKESFQERKQETNSQETVPMEAYSEAMEDKIQSQSETSSQKSSPSGETGHEEIDRLLRESASQFSPMSAFANTPLRPEEKEQLKETIAQPAPKEEVSIEQYFPEQLPDPVEKTENIDQEENIVKQTEQKTVPNLSASNLSASNLSASNLSASNFSAPEPLVPVYQSENTLPGQNNGESVQDSHEKTEYEPTEITGQKALPNQNSDESVESSHGEPEYTRAEETIGQGALPPLPEIRDLEGKQKTQSERPQQQTLREKLLQPEGSQTSSTENQDSTNTYFDGAQQARTPSREKSSSRRTVLLAGVPLAVFAVLGAGGWYAYQAGWVPETVTAIFGGLKKEQSSTPSSSSTSGGKENQVLQVQGQNEEYTTIPESFGTDSNLENKGGIEKPSRKEGELEKIKTDKDPAMSEKALSLNFINPASSIKSDPSVKPEKKETTKPQPSDSIADLQLAARSGDVLSQYKLAIHYQTLEKTHESFLLMKKAADSGFAPAQMKLGHFYEDGIGTSINLEKAFYYYEKAAEVGNRHAMNSLGNLYASKKSGEVNYPLAVEWFNKAAVLGLVSAQYNLGVLYEYGYGVSKSLPDAYAWYSIAARSGDTEAHKQAQRIRAQIPKDTLKDVDDLIENFKVKPMNNKANSIFEDV